MAQLGEGISPFVPEPEQPEEKQEEKKKGTYQITIGAHLDGPNDWIGHAFISVEYPKGKFTTKGFWPKNGFDLGEKSDRKGVIVGMPGAVLDDSEYLTKSGVKKKSFAITEDQAKAALDKIKEYESTQPEYNLITNQCATFATKVLRAAGKSVRAGAPPRPTVLHKNLE